MKILSVAEEEPLILFRLNTPSSSWWFLTLEKADLKRQVLEKERFSPVMAGNRLGSTVYSFSPLTEG